MELTQSAESVDRESLDWGVWPRQHRDPRVVQAELQAVWSAMIPRSEQLHICECLRRHLLPVALVEGYVADLALHLDLLGYLALVRRYSHQKNVDEQAQRSDVAHDLVLHALTPTRHRRVTPELSLDLKGRIFRLSIFQELVDVVLAEST